MNILDLLKSGVVVQGHHTRLLFDGTEFEVLSKMNPNSARSSYVVREYIGPSESAAVEEFVRSENE